MRCLLGFVRGFEFFAAAAACYHTIVPERTDIQNLPPFFTPTLTTPIIPESETPKSKTSSGNVFTDIDILQKINFMKQNLIIIKPQAIWYVALFVDF